MSSQTVTWPKLKRDLVGILRGVKPDEVGAIVDELLEAGFEAIEVPLNSPDPLKSIEIAARRAPSGVLIGAGTVLTVEDVNAVHDAGGSIVVSPNTEPDVIRQTVAKGMVSMPGVFSPTDALAAARAGATCLKFFPAGILGASGIKAMSAVLPKGLPIGAVGGVSEKNFAEYAKVGIRTFGLGSSLYSEGASAAEVRERADAAVKVYDEVFGV